MFILFYTISAFLTNAALCRNIDCTTPNDINIDCTTPNDINIDCTTPNDINIDCTTPNDIHLTTEI